MRPFYFSLPALSHDSLVSLEEENLFFLAYGGHHVCRVFVGFFCF